MATPKKPTTKKSVAKKPATKAASAKAPSKKPVAKASSKKQTKKHSRHRLISLSLVPDDAPFFTLRLTTQTLYWLIFAVTILALGLWILKLNLDIISLYNQIDQNNISASQTYPTTKHPATTKK